MRSVASTYVAYKLIFAVGHPALGGAAGDDGLVADNARQHQPFGLAVACNVQVCKFLRLYWAAFFLLRDSYLYTHYHQAALLDLPTMLHCEGIDTVLDTLQYLEND